MLVVADRLFKQGRRAGTMISLPEQERQAESIFVPACIIFAVDTNILNMIGGMHQ
jgi:hypothetical protein